MSQGPGVVAKSVGGKKVCEEVGFEFQMKLGSDESAR